MEAYAAGLCVLLFQLDLSTKGVLKKSVVFPLLHTHPQNLTKILHLLPNKTILWFHLGLTKIFRKYLGKKCGEELWFTIPKISLFVKSLICTLARDIGNSAEAI